MADSIWTKVTKSISEALQDISSLEVRTFTGTVTAVIKDSAGETKELVNWENLFAESKKDGLVKLAAATKIYIDGDADNYFRDGLSEEVKNAHNSAIKSGIDMRVSLVNVLAKAVNLK